MFKTLIGIIAIGIATGFISVFLLNINSTNAQPSNPCGPSDNAASSYAPGGPGGYPPGNNPFNSPPGSAPGQLKADQTPLP